MKAYTVQPITVWNLLTLCCQRTWTGEGLQPWYIERCINLVANMGWTTNQDILCYICIDSRSKQMKSGFCCWSRQIFLERDVVYWRWGVGRNTQTHCMSWIWQLVNVSLVWSWSFYFLQESICMYVSRAQNILTVICWHWKVITVLPSCVTKSKLRICWLSIVY